MKLDVLLSGMYLEDYHYIDTLNIAGDCVVINQCDKEEEKVFCENNRHICYIETKARGLSRSRNQAIANSEADICILCDNDVEYLPDYEKKIISEYEKHPEYDVIAFHVTSDVNRCPVFPSARKLNYITCSKIISYEITFRKKSIHGIKFNERIGAGTKYKMGEENAFLYECLRRGLKLYYVPVEIARLRYEPTTWNTGFDRSYLESRGASFYAMTTHFWPILVLQFAFRKIKLYRNSMTPIQAIKFMVLGIRKYKNDESPR